jgi:long-chain fatty acid transport protein
MDIPLDWEDGWILKLGIEYRIEDRLALRGGYTFVTQLVPEETLTPANPDADQHTLSLGVGTTVGRLTIDAFFSFCVYADREVANAIADGTYRTLSQGLGVSLGWRF